MASAARKDFERFERFESASNRLFVFGSIRIESVSFIFVLTCTHLRTITCTRAIAAVPPRMHPNLKAGWFRLLLGAVLALSCKPGRDVIRSLHEDYHRTVARAAGGGYRSGIARPEDFKVRRSS